MIAIPNVGKPQNCAECPMSALSEFSGIVCKLNRNNNKNNCPLIEIDKEIDLVRCGECKYSKVYTLQSDAPMKRWCHKGHFPKEVTDGYFCGDGERRADETQP